MIQLFDKTGKRIEALENDLRPFFSQRYNEANEISFSLPLNDDKVPLLSLVRSFKYFWDRDRVIGGKITKRDSDPEKGIRYIQGITNEIYLEKEPLTTPQNWTHWNGMDLVDVFKDLLNEFVIYRQNTYLDFQNAIEVHQVDINTDPGRIFLAQYDDSYSPYNADEEAYEEVRPCKFFYKTGYIILEFAVQSSEWFEWLRWKQEVGEVTFISFQYSTYDGAQWSAYSAEFGKNSPEDTPENDGFPLPVGSIQKIRTKIILNMTLTNEELIKTKAYSDEDVIADPELVQVFGVTPILDAVEVICRKPNPHVVTGDIPDSTGLLLSGFEFDEDNHLNIARQLCEEYGYEFYIDHEKKLHVSTKFGADKSKEIILIESENIKIVQLSDSDTNIVTHVKAKGAGEGPNQLYINEVSTLESEAYADEVGEKFWAEFEDESIVDLTELRTAAEALINLDGTGEFGVNVVGHENLPKFWLGDSITVVRPEDKTKFTGRVVKLDGTEDENSKSLQINLDNTPPNLLDTLAVAARLRTGLKTSLNPPTNLKARGNRLYWSGEVNTYLAQYSLDGTNWRNIGRVFGKTLEMKTVDYGAVFYFRVAPVKDRYFSDWSEPIKTKMISLNYYTVLIAASDSPEKTKHFADIVCTGTNDDVVINEALAKIKKGGTIELTQGTFSLSKVLLVPSFTKIRGQGKATILKTSATANEGVDTIKNKDSVNELIIIESLTIDGSGRGNGIHLTQVDDFDISTCTIRNAYLYGIFGHGSTRGMIGRCVIKNGTFDGINIDGKNVHVTSTIVDSNLVGVNMAFCENYSVQGCTVINNKREGISLSANTDDCTISGNTVNGNSQEEDNKYSNIWLGADASRNNIQNNIIRIGGNINRPKYGIEVEFPWCENNFISNNDLLNSGATGALHDAGTGTIKVNNRM